jgi:ribose transport system permease protein
MKSWLVFSRQTAMLAVAIGIYALFALGAPHFLDPLTQFEILRVTAFTLLIGLPLTFLVIAGEVDLSIGSNYGLCSVLTALAIVDWNWSPWLAAGLAILVGGGVGLFNGLVVVKLRVPAFILTIGMLSLLRGLALILTMGQSIDIPAEIQGGFFAVSGGKLGPVPVQVLWAAAAFVIGGVLLRQTLFGARLYATGGNPKAALQLGVQPGRIKIWTFAMLGFMCGLAGALTAGWLRIGAPNTGAGGELQIIAAVIIGGTALSGGVGSVGGTLLGALIVSMLQTGLVLMGVQGDWVQVCVGGLIVIAATIEPQLRADAALAGLLRRFGAGGPAR